MWRVESQLDDAGAPYDRRAAAYDRLVRSRLYRVAWSTSPEDYSEFAASASASAVGPLLEVAAGSAAATAALHARSPRPTVLVDLSRAMLECAGRNIAAAANGRADLWARIRLVQADLLALPPPTQPFTTVLGLGLTHLFDDASELVNSLRGQLAPDGRLYLAGLVAELAAAGGTFNSSTVPARSPSLRSRTSSVLGCTTRWTSRLWDAWPTPRSALGPPRHRRPAEESRGQGPDYRQVSGKSWGRP